MIHHYTSVASLAMILKNKTLRFTRLDQLDDMQEAQSEIEMQFGMELYVSCWTKDSNEDIPQWAMYGDRLEGARLSLPDNPFIWHDLNIDVSHERHGVRILNIEAPYGEGEVFGRGYVLAPTSAYQRRDLGSDVHYVDSRETYFKSLIKYDKSGKVTVPLGTHMLAIVKGKQWEFQREYRFIISAIWGPDLDYADAPDVYIEELAGRMRKARKGEKLLSHVKHIDLILSAEAVSQAEITIGPLAPDSARILVESLVATYAPNIKIKDSALKGTLRAKRT